MLSLAEFQSSFTEQLLSPALMTMPDGDAAAITVYRNTVMKGLIDALAASYPTVLKLVGEEWFNAAAIRFINHSPAATPILSDYGRDFPVFLAGFAPAQELPYLHDVACIDWLWIESYFAANAPVLRANVLQSLQGEDLLTARLQLHPATRLCACQHSALSIWLHNHDEDVSSTELHVDDGDEEAVITRTDNGVEISRLCLIEYRFLSEIHQDCTLGEAAVTALSLNPEFPLASTLAKLLNAGCFAKLSILQQREHK